MEFKKYVVEFSGTMFLVLLGCGAAVAYTFSAGWLAVALVFGLTVMALTYCYGNISGCHINPAVTLAMFITKKIDFKDCIGYMISQFLGGIVGILVLMIFFRTDTGLGANGFNTLSNWDFTWWQAFIIEMLLSWFFVMVVLAVKEKKLKYSGGIVIGLTFALVYVVALPLTGASINPARSLAPAIFVGGAAIRQVWVFILAPLVGAILAACGSRMMNKQEKTIEIEER